MKRGVLWLSVSLAACAVPATEKAGDGGGHTNGSGGRDGSARDSGGGGFGRDLANQPLPDFSEPAPDFAETPDAAAAPADFARNTDLASGCVDGGMACTTGSPGACASGHLSCTATPTCLPDVTTQPCYSGAANTKDKGICHAGTQACTGALGACMGEVTPAAKENCFNNLDDDCDGVVNNGCAISVTVGTAVPRSTYGGTGGTAGSTRCPAGQFAGALRLYADDAATWAAGVGLFCSTPTLVKGASSYSISVTNIAAATLNTPTLVGSGADLHGDGPNCTASGLGAVWASRLIPDLANNGSTYVSGIYYSCATGAVAIAADNKLSVTFTNANNYYGFTYGGTASDDNCPAGSVLVGYDGHTGSWMDEIQPVCAPLVFTYQ